MFYRIFNIPIPDSEGELERMNKFLGGVRVISIQKEVVTAGGFSYWSFAVEYFRENVNRDAARKSKVDYKEILSDEDFSVFSVLRELRKAVAEEQGLPVYAVFTNEQLSLMVTGKVESKAALAKISGVGEKKIADFGDRFLKAIGEIHEKGRKSL